MYSETRHKQAVAAKQSWETVDLTGLLSAARKNEAALLAEQLATEEKLKAAYRDTKAFSMVLGGPLDNTLRPDIESELGILVGPGLAAPDKARTAKAVLDALDKQVKAERDLKEVGNEFARYGLEMPPCASIEDPNAIQALDEWIQANPGGKGSDITNARTVARSRCTDLDAAKAAKAANLSSLTGTLKQTILDIELAIAAQEASRQAGIVQRNQYRAAAQTLDAAAKALEVSPTAARDKVDSALARLKTAVDALERLPDAFSAKFISDARIDKLNEVLAAVDSARESGKPPADAGTAARILSEFPDLFDRTRVAFADAQKPRLAPLVLMKNLEKVKADVAAREVESKLLRETLLREKFSWEVERLRALTDAHRFLTNNCGPCLGWTLAEALHPVDESQLAGPQGKQIVQAKANVLKAASLYLDAQGRLAASANKTEHRIRALEHEEALTLVEGNIGQWNTLISSVIGQLNDYAASGIKSEDIGALFNAAALLWIGKGVN